MIALASPASLKGVLIPLEAARASPRGCDALPGVQADEATGRRRRRGNRSGSRARARRWVAHGRRRRSVRSRLSTATWLVLPDGTAVVESREAVGLPRLTPDERDPLRASSTRAGELLLAALARRPAAVLVVRRRDSDRRRRRRDARRRRRRRLDGFPFACSATSATRCSASAAPRACSARRRAPARTMSRSSRRGSRRWTSSSRTATYRGRRGWRARRGLRRARRRARRGCRARARH